MLFSALHFAVDPLLIALIVFAVVAALGCAHALANARKEGIKRSKAFYRIATLAREAHAPHHEKYYLAKATGDLFEAAHQAHELEELAIDTARARNAMDTAAEHWLEHEALDPQRRRKIIRDIERLEKHNHGTELGALEDAVLKVLKGMKETATVPDGAGGTTTVPVKTEVHHHHYGSQATEADKAKTAPAGPVAPLPVGAA